ncbi:YkgJ family cysteine cluster protein [Kordiimonas aquimaris]|uniref:YkgJ family cysteine cluster protein n=1 Tax=Kordiimonas aquimaris TaxID=707591 RepID=UPI0021CF16A9|nr:YkgJ family cysteine cluster protein [Kordiimonas aquimaris]
MTENLKSDNKPDEHLVQVILSAKQSGELCQACGVCCTGAFFSHVNVAEKEVDRLSGTLIKTYTGKKGKPVFDQPCPALCGTSCSIYDKRPGSCRAFLCKLTRNVLNGQADLEAALETVTELKALTVWLRANAPAQVLEPMKSTSSLQQSAEHTLAVWQGKTEAENASSSSKALLVMLTNLHVYYSRKQHNAALTEQDKEYITNAFAFAKLCDREFAETSLLRKYAQLVQRF